MYTHSAVTELLIFYLNCDVFSMLSNYLPDDHNNNSNKRYARIEHIGTSCYRLHMLNIFRRAARMRCSCACMREFVRKRVVCVYVCACACMCARAFVRACAYVWVRVRCTCESMFTAFTHHARA
jgi:hypothetical protein